MRPSKKYLKHLLIERLTEIGLDSARIFDEASEVIVFGSMAVGISRTDSDIDVLCIGEGQYKIKRPFLDLIGVPVREANSKEWLQGELASHVAKYGTWLKGAPQWLHAVRIGPSVVAQKRRRIRRFMRFLPLAWSRLEPCFREKYSIKLRRETQRLILLEQRIPVPPTKVLDDSWTTTLARPPYEVIYRLRQLALETCGAFIEDLLDHIDTHFSKPAHQQSIISTRSRQIGTLLVNRRREKQ